MTPLGTAALNLARKGLAVFPLRPKTKEPYADDRFYRTIGGYKCATRDQSLIEFWWDRHPDNNIGIATGSVSAIWVLDVDGDEGRETLATLEEKHGQLPPTVEVVTPGKINKTTGVHTGKGLHLYFRYPLGLDIRSGQERDDLPGIDWRGNGGYVCAPPSLHPDGGVYAWSIDSADAFADAPDWLIKRLTASPATPRSDAPVEPIPSDVWSKLTHQPVTDYRDYAAARIAGHLFRHYVDHQLVRGLLHAWNSAWCQPPLGFHELERIIARIADREAARIERRLAQ